MEWCWGRKNGERISLRIAASRKVRVRRSRWPDAPAGRPRAGVRVGTAERLDGRWRGLLKERVLNEKFVVTWALVDTGST